MHARKRDPSETYTLFDRFAIAFACVLVSLPLAWLFWAIYGPYLSLWLFVTPAIGLTLLAFVRPVLATDALAWLVRVLHRLGSW